MLTNGAITIYTTIKNRDTTNLIANFITPVSIHGERSESTSNNNITDKDKYTIRIPQLANKQFTDYELYCKDFQRNCYSVKKGDYCILGSVDKEINTLSQLLNEYGDKVYKVVSVTDNRDISKYTSHIKLVIE